MRKILGDVTDCHRYIYIRMSSSNRMCFRSDLKNLTNVCFSNIELINITENFFYVIKLTRRSFFYRTIFSQYLPKEKYYNLRLYFKLLKKKSSYIS